MKREAYLPEKPGQVKVSLTNVCNYRCVMCPNASFKQPRGFMDDPLAYRIIDDCVASGIRRLSLGASGEPLLHRQFTAYLRYAKSKGLWVSTATNCSVLTPALADEILSIGIDRMTLSVYSASPEEHKRYCSNNNFEAVVRNVTHFLEQWNAGGRKTSLNMGFLAIPGMNDEKTFMQFWKPVTDRYGLVIEKKEAVNWAGSLDVFPDSVAVRRWGITRVDGHRVLRCSRVVPCSQVPSYMYILHDGSVHPCCNFPDSTDHPEMCFGNIRDMTLVEAWQSPRYQAFRERQYDCDIRGFAPCLACEARLQMTEIRPWAAFTRLLSRWGHRPEKR